MCHSTKIVILFHTHALEFIPFQKLRLDNGKAKKLKFSTEKYNNEFWKRKQLTGQTSLNACFSFIQFNSTVRLEQVDRLYSTIIISPNQRLFLFLFHQKCISSEKYNYVFSLTLFSYNFIFLTYF